MTKVFYRVGDKIITSYEEFLKTKDSAEPSYMFLVEGMKTDTMYDTFEEYQRRFKVRIPKNYY